MTPDRLRTLLADVGVTPHAVSGKETVYRCPRCGRPKLYVDAAKPAYLCFRCGLSGRSLRRLAQLLSPDLDLTDAAAPPAVPRPVPLPDALIPPPCPLPERFQPLTDPDDPLQAPYWAYLAGRGLDAALVRAYRIGFCASGRYGGRVVIPVLQAGAVRGWVARDAFARATAPKVLTPRGVPQSRLLYNLERALAHPEGPVLVEGVFDALALPDRGVATFGKHLAAAQRALLVAAGVRQLTIAWDGDAWRESVAAARALAPFALSVRCARLPADAKDPAELAQRDPQALAAALAAARPVTAGDLLLATTTAISVGGLR